MKQKLTIKWEPKIPLGVAQKYFDKLTGLENSFYAKVANLEIEMQNETGIEDIEFFCNDGEYCGIGNASRTIKLIHRS